MSAFEALEQAIDRSNVDWETIIANAVSILCVAYLFGRVLVGICA
jgi:hypothetical protein